ncbi:MAG: 2-succinylbenzoate--CoA ligase [Dehalococcoidia bacterium]|nr:MAG: 2-succinylbenzoate--CoA ligase [Dehalococcoidia bacterium]
MSTEQLPEWLGQRAALTPGRLAVLAADGQWSYRELDERAEGAAQQLRALGVQPGDRVALLAENSAAYAALVHAIPRAGGVLVPLNLRLTISELATQLRARRVRLLIHSQRETARARAVAAQGGQPGCAGLEALVAQRVPSPGVRPVELARVHSIIATSGTTGQPKGVLLTVGNLTWSAVGSVLALGVGPSDRWLACLPFFHIGGLAILVRAALAGLPVVIHARFDPAAVNAALDEQQVSLLSVVATMLERLLAARGERPFPASLRCVLLGGGPVPPALLETCARRAVPVVQTYGLTEAASQVTTLLPEEAGRTGGSAGKPLFPTEVRIVDAHGAPLPAGTLGEIVVRGPTVSPGYDGEPPPERPGGWLRTGDLGWLDDEGYLYVSDRRDDLIVSGGENISPAEVEAVIRQHPAVAEVAVVGVRDPVWGQQVVAVVVPASGHSLQADAILGHCRARLAGYKVPRRVVVRAELPRTASGKVQRGQLRTWLEDEAVPPGESGRLSS